MKFLKAGIAAGIVMFIVMVAVGMLCQMVFNYDQMAIPGMRSVSDPRALLFILTPFVISFIMAYVYPKFSTKNGMEFGLVIWLVYIVPSAFIVFTAMDYPIGFTINQLGGGLIQLIAGGMVIQKMYRA